MAVFWSAQPTDHLGGRQGLGRSGPVSTVAAFGDSFVAVGSEGDVTRVWTSIDGRAWTVSPFWIPSVSLYDVAVCGNRLLATGMVTVADPTSFEGERSFAGAWLSVDGGATWADAGIDLLSADSAAALAIGDGFLLVAMPHVWRSPLRAWRLDPAQAAGWIATDLGDSAVETDRAWPGRRPSPSRIVLAGSTTGTGAGGDRDAIWVGDLPR
jgi:hypothetical protein